MGYHWNRLDEYVLNPCLLFTITSLYKISFIQPGNKHCGDKIAVKMIDQQSTYLRIFDDSPELFHNGLVDVSLLADHCVVLVVGVVGIPAV